MKDYHLRKLTTTENTVNLLWLFTIENWKKIVLYGFILFLVLRLIIYLINIYLLHFFKWILQAKVLLEITKGTLEKPYEEFLWNDYEFCKRYLDLYAKFRELRIALKQGNYNTLDVDAMEFMRFEDVKLCRMIKNKQKINEEVENSEEEGEDNDDEDD
uniref:Uncharacterized protein n=1 Tax=Strongyloides venezuelensis TaxID=75913 RepID=A0A0K0FZ17_STRVS